MIVVAILGVLSAIAIPAFRTVLYRAKTSEAVANLGVLFKGGAAYYNLERADQGQNGQQLRSCIVSDTPGRLPATPGTQKQVLLSTDPSLHALAFSVGDYVYYSYGVITPTGSSECNLASDTASVYTFYADGDLDGDSVFSKFELAVGSDPNNQLYHARGVYISNELE